MKKIKYKDQNKKNYKKIIIVLFVMIFILLLVNNYLSKLENDDNQVVEYDQLSSIKDVIEFHKSKYISENIRDGFHSLFFFCSSFPSFLLLSPALCPPF